MTEDLTQTFKETFFSQEGELQTGMPVLNLNGAQKHQLMQLKHEEFLEAISALYLHKHRPTRHSTEPYLDDHSFLGSRGKISLLSTITLRDIFEQVIMAGIITSQDETPIDPSIIGQYMDNKIGLMDVVRSIDHGFSVYLYYAQKACIVCELLISSNQTNQQV